MSCVPWPTLKLNFAERSPASRLEIERIRYSTPSPERRSDMGFLSYKEMSDHRCLMSSGVSLAGGSALESDGV